MKYIMSTLLAVSSLALGAEEKPFSWTPKAMMDLQGISDVQISPQSDAVLFVATEAVMTEDTNRYISRIYKTKADGKEEPFLFSLYDHSSVQPRWSFDGKWVAFLSEREGIKNLYLIRPDGGEAMALTHSKAAVQTFAWSKDSKQIAFVMSDETELEKKRKKTSAAYVYKERTKINRLWLIDIDSLETRALTSDAYSVRGMGDFGNAIVEFDWSLDGKTIVFAYSPSLAIDDFHLDSSLAAVDVATGEISPWEKQAFYEACPRYAPDGQLVAYLSSNSPKRYALDRRLAVRSADGTGYRQLAATFNESPSLFGPAFVGWTQDGKNLLFLEPKQTKTHIVFVPVDGSPAEDSLSLKEGFLKDATLSCNGTAFGFVAQGSMQPPEAFIAKVEAFDPIQISHLNRSFLSYPQIKTEKFSWKSSDGMDVEGLLSYPSSYKEGEQCPLLVVIHGGPMGVFDETFIGITSAPYPLAAFAEAGFMIFRPNPRGSTGYGKAFRSANFNDWGGMDFQDIMTGVDELISKKLVDAEKMGVLGWSYGGYLTAWTITQTGRFKAASMGAGLSNLVSLTGTTDLDRFVGDFMGDFLGTPGLYEERSPVMHAHHVVTPCLIQHGTADLRVPVAQAYEFYHALRRKGKTTTLVLYPDMGHRLTDPKMHLDAMQTNLEWFQEHVFRK